jgi:hypothetical protein
MVCRLIGPFRSIILPDDITILLAFSKGERARMVVSDRDCGVERPVRSEVPFLQIAWPCAPDATLVGFPGSDLAGSGTIEMHGTSAGVSQHSVGCP